ncbi:aurora kinase A- and ninein-interacting protein isoform X1 [Pseudophryne corroboree]|uniref:aurora kinase A- and ninein-interacting protein isoform X1 n=1 Tax=Pseudophryne corroboree TaxID=495146 RepID=UPI0030818347
MKIRSSRRARSPQHPQHAEQCGVWLDTAELKRRSQQTLIPCTSSNRLNPLSRRHRIDSAVFDFTQTKITPLCTKQTSMYSFFTPPGTRNKQTCNSLVNTSVQNYFNNSCKKKSNTENINKVNSSTSEPSVCLNQMYSMDEHAVHKEDVNLYRDKQHPAHSEQNENEEVSGVSDKPGNQMTCFNNHSPLRTEDHSVKSSDCWTSGAKSPLYLSDLPKDEYDQESNGSSPYWLGSQLFTQDTQGNRVISHRFTSEQQRNCYPAGPLQDRTNFAWDVASPLRGTPQTLRDEVSLHNMFTQDSEGNMVIKH